jgi:hypothetical protein
MEDKSLPWTYFNGTSIALQSITDIALDDLVVKLSKSQLRSLANDSSTGHSVSLKKKLI